MSSTPTTVFIFRRDLRRTDNWGLIEAFSYAVENKSQLLPIFLFNSDVLDPEKNKYFSHPSVQFMVGCLKNLKKQLNRKDLTFHTFIGNDDVEILAKIKEVTPINAIFTNEDYTLFARKRDRKIIDFCGDNGIEFIHTHDYLLHKPNTIVTKSTRMVSKTFKSFYESALKTPVKYHISNVPDHATTMNLLEESFAILDINTDFEDDEDESEKFNAKYTGTFDFEFPENEWDTLYKPLKHILYKGGRKEIKKLMRSDSYKERLENYSHDRDILSRRTAEISPHLKFGTISIREYVNFIHENLTGSSHDSHLRQVIWREFYYHLYSTHGKNLLKPDYNPDMNSGRSPEWVTGDLEERRFREWCTATTGVPIIDACMRQMLSTGYMHNRGRLITANFLIHRLKIDWRKGEQFFAQNLIDYDPIVNNGNWQWVAGTGINARPRVYNVQSQAKKHDPTSTYQLIWRSMPDE